MIVLTGMFNYHRHVLFLCIIKMKTLFLKVMGFYCLKRLGPRDFYIIMFHNSVIFQKPNTTDFFLFANMELPAIERDCLNITEEQPIQQE